MARRSFWTAPDGSRLFSTGLSYLYLVPDNETEQRLLRKQMILMQVFLWGIVCGVLISSRVVPSWKSEFYPLLVTIAAVLLLYKVVGRFLFRRELSKLSRAKTNGGGQRLRWRMSDQFSFNELDFVSFCSVVLVAMGIWNVITGDNPAEGWILICISGLSLINCIRSLIQKRRLAS